MDNVLESIFGTINLQIPTMPPKVSSPITLNLQNLKIPPKGTLPTTLNLQIPSKTVSLSTRFLKNEKKLEKECAMCVGFQSYSVIFHPFPIFRMSTELSVLLRCRKG